MTIKDISLVSIMGTSTFKATVENVTDTLYNNREITILFTDKNGEEYAKLDSLIEQIQPKETYTIDASSSFDISNAYDFTIIPK